MGLKKSLLIVILLLASPSMFAWDSVGHRLSTSIALQFISEDTRRELIEILKAHPRYEEDFIDQVPGFVDQSDEPEFSTWLLGQAAFWPDIARRLPEPDRTRYNRPDWHYTDGAWIRGTAQISGDNYIGVSARPLLQGEAASSIRNANQAHNVVTAIDYNTRLLANKSADAADRAIALCWILHLMGDIHQPLHTGSLFSRSLFERGDRGGNGVETEAGRSLHSEWDSALREAGIDASIPLILDSIEKFGDAELAQENSDWTAWMAESREILLSTVYTEEMKDAIATADESGHRLGQQQLGASYRAEMQAISRQRLGLAGLRIAAFLNRELN